MRIFNGNIDTARRGYVRHQSGFDCMLGDGVSAIGRYNLAVGSAIDAGRRGQGYFLRDAKAHQAFETAPVIDVLF
jgi:hypothetical protein